MKFLFKTMVLLICFCIMFSAQAKTENAVKIYTTFYPLYFFTKQLVNDNAKVINLLPEEADAAFWMPDKKLVLAMQKDADLIIANGAHFEKWLNMVSLPPNKIIKTSQSFHDKFIAYKDGKEHSHGGHTHTHIGIDPHTWVNPHLASMQVKEIEKALLSLNFSDQDKTTIKNNAQKIYQKLTQINNNIINITQNSKENIVLLANHPAYNYLAKEYNLNIINVDISPDEPLKENIKEIIKQHVKNKHIKYMLWESNPDDFLKKDMATNYKLESLVFSPLENMKDYQNKNYFKLYNINLEALKTIYNKK